MKTVDFLREHSACSSGAKGALSVSSDMSAAWDALVDQGKHEWLFWIATRPGVFPDSTLRRLACRFVRETPVGNGRTVWNLLTDERSRKAVEVAEAYADGKATEAELSAASAAAYDAAYADAWAARSAADAAADAAAYAAGALAATAAWAAAAFSAPVSAALSSAEAAEAAARATTDADLAAAYEAAYAAQVQMIAELGNPFKKES